MNLYAIIHDSYTKQFMYDITYTQIIDYGIHNQSICDNSRFIYNTIRDDNSRFIYETIHIRYKVYTNIRL